MDIGARLKALRGKKSREKVASDLGLSSSAIGMYESNQRTPKDETKVKLAEYYGVTVQQLFLTQNVT